MRLACFLFIDKTLLSYFIINHVQTKNTDCIMCLLASARSVAHKVTGRDPGKGLAHRVGGEQLTLLCRELVVEEHVRAVEQKLSSIGIMREKLI